MTKPTFFRVVLAAALVLSHQAVSVAQVKTDSVDLRIKAIAAPDALSPGFQPGQALVNQLAVNPENLGTPQVRGSVSAALGAVRREKGGLVRLTAKSIAARIDALRKSFSAPRDLEEVPTDFPANSARAASPRARHWTKSLALAASLFGVSAPAIAQNAPHPLPAPPLIVAQISGAQASQGAYVEARDINDLIAKYDKNVHLYVIGDVTGLGAAEYRALAGFLADKHWVVVLVDDASGERYTDAEGRTHVGEDAVEFGTGQGVFKKAGFQAFVNAETGETDGSILTFIMKQRVLLLRNSKAQDARGFNGETQFKDNLDRWAKAKMRSGGDVKGAVEETVANIDALLAQAVADDVSSAKTAVADAKEQIRLLESYPKERLGRYDIAAMKAQVAKAEKLAEKKDFRGAASAASAAASQAASGARAMRDFEESRASAQQELVSARTDLAQLESAAASFHAAHPRMTGILARPDTKAMGEALTQSEKTLAADPAQAAAQARQVRAQIKGALEAIAQYPSGGQMIETAESRLAELQGKRRSSAAAQELAAAKTALGEAREQWETGGADWTARLAEGKGRLDAAGQAIAGADAAAETKDFLFRLFGILGLLGTFFSGLFLHLRVRAPRAKARGLYTDWNTALDRKLEVMLTELEGKMSTFIGPTTGPAAGRYAGETATLAVQTREDIGSLHIIWGSASKVLERAKALVYPSVLFKKLRNFFLPSRFAEAMRLLENEPVTFKPEDGLEDLFGKKKDWKDDLLGDLKSYKPFSMSFQKLMAEFNQRAARAAEALDLIEKSILGAGPALRKVEEAVAAVEAQKAPLETAGSQDGLYLVPSVFSALIPAAKAAAAKTAEVVKTDPVGGLKGSGADATRLSSDAAALVETVAAARRTSIPAANAAAVAMASAGAQAPWIEAELNRLSGRAEALAVKAVLEPADEKIAGFGKELEALAEKAGDAAAVTEEWTDAKANRIEKASVAIESVRLELGRALGLDADAVMREQDADPADFIAEASKQAALTRKALGEGDLGSARKALEALADFSAQAKSIVDASKASVDGHESAMAERRGETARLEDLLPEHRKILASIAKTYAQSALTLGAGDPTHPNGDGTVENNGEEIAEHIQKSKEKTEQAARVFRQGKVLEAANLLAQVAAHQESAAHRLSEIKEKQARLEKAVADNGAALTKLDERVRGYDQEIAGDRRTTAPTLKAYQDAKKDLELARAAVEAVKGDPFKAAALLASVGAALDQAWVKARNDRDAHAEAERSLSAARQGIDKAKGEAASAAGDGVEDSPEIRKAYRDIDALAQAYAAAMGRFGREHGDWNEVDVEADRIAAAASGVAAALRGEIQAAASASSAISGAAAKVRQATNWTGSYNVSIPGSPGSGSLESARAALRGGDYEGASRHAENARRTAAGAIADAEAEVLRLRRAEEARLRRIEEERRRKQREEDDRKERQERARLSNNNGGGSSGSGSGKSSSGRSSSGSGKSGW